MIQTKIEDVFSPMIGQLAWSVRRGVGSFLTLEFGCPHLLVREPIQASVDSSRKVSKNLARRRVHVLGERHFWIQYSKWQIDTKNYTINSDNVGSSSTEDCLNELSGQMLVSVGYGADPRSCVFKFDLGGLLTTSPLGEIDGDQWSIHKFGGEIISFKRDGTFVLDPASERS